MKYPITGQRNDSIPDLSREEHAAVRRLIEELKRLYGRMAECLDDIERRDATWNAIRAKEREIDAIVPQPRVGS